MNYKKYNKKVLTTFFITIFVIITINYLVNPFNIFTQRIFPNTLLKPEATLQERLTKPIALKIDNKKIDTIFIGTSRVDLGINKSDYEKLTNKTATNIALKGLIFEELEPMLNMALLAHPEIKNIYLAVDFYTFSKYVGEKNDIGRIKITKNPKLEMNEIAFALISMKTTTNSIWAVVKNLIGIEKRMYYKEGHQHIFVNKNIQDEFNGTIAEYDAKYKEYELDYDKLNEFKNYIKDLKRKNSDRNIQLFIMPTHITIQNKLDENKKRNVYKKWYSELSTLGNVYDFNIKNEYTTEEIKPDMQYFLDGSHASHKFGEIIIKDLLSDKPIHAIIHKEGVEYYVI